MLRDNWYRCYGESWKGAIVDPSFSHPAKFSRSLIRAIYDHALAEGWLEAGDRVLDPFCGVALGALDAMRLGLHWTGIELEQKFVDLGRQNIALWDNQFRGVLPGWGTATLLQGDSRRLGEVIQERMQAAISSPPYAESMGNAKSGIDWSKQADRESSHPHGYDGEGYGQAPGQLGAMRADDFEVCVSSPPYTGSLEHRGGIDSDLSQHAGGPHSQMNNSDTRYGETDGQLGAMGAGDFDACVSSPPYGAGETRDRWSVSPDNMADCMTRAYTQDRQGDTEGNLAHMDACVSSPPFENVVGSDDPDKRGGLYRDPKRHGDVNLTGTYGESEGQLGAMAGGFEAAVSSPPFETTGVGGSNNVVNLNTQCVSHNRPDTIAPDEEARGLTYGNTDGQLGAEQAETFWSAARVIVKQVYSLLVPGGVAIWVVKDFIRNKERVEFSQQWAALNEACGFEWLHEHRCWVVEDRGTQLGFFEDEDRIVERKSFFRRLYESKYPDNRIDWESVLCMRKPKDRGVPTGIL